MVGNSLGVVLAHLCLELYQLWAVEQVVEGPVRALDSLDLAVALVTALLEDAHSYRLGEWEPSLLRRVLLLFLSLSEEREIALPKEARGQLLAQLSRIDPVEASLR